MHRQQGTRGLWVCNDELTRGRATLGAHEPGLLVAFKERLPVLDPVTNSSSSQPECEETWLRLYWGQQGRGIRP